MTASFWIPQCKTQVTREGNPLVVTMANGKNLRLLFKGVDRRVMPDLRFCESAHTIYDLERRDGPGDDEEASTAIPGQSRVNSREIVSEYARDAHQASFRAR